MDRFTDSFLSEVSPDKALQHRIRAEVILGRSLLAKHLAGGHDQSSHGSWALDRFDRPDGYDGLNVPAGELPDTVYHVTSSKNDQAISAGGLHAHPENTWNTGAGSYNKFEDNWIWGKGEDGEWQKEEYRPVGVYVFGSLNAAKNYAQSGNSIYSIDTKITIDDGADVIRDPSWSENWDYMDDPESQQAWVFNNVPVGAISLVMQKHLAGQHDQRTHGSWAGGGAGVNIIADIDKLFYNPDDEVNQETQDVIKQMDEKELANGHGMGDNALKIIAERQGFTEKPKIVSTVAELKQLQEAEGGTIVYRGISEWRRLEESGLNPAVITYTAEQAVEQFKRGEYFAGWGAFGTGTYTTIKGDEASAYANDYDESEDIYGNGKVIAMHIPKNAKMPTQQQVKIAMSKVNYLDGPNVKTYVQNVARILAAQGFQAYNAGLVQDDKKDYFVILDRSMLTVADQDWTFGL